MSEIRVPGYFQAHALAVAANHLLTGVFPAADAYQAGYRAALRDVLERMEDLRVQPTDPGMMLIKGVQEMQSEIRKALEE